MGMTNKQKYNIKENANNKTSIIYLIEDDKEPKTNLQNINKIENTKWRKKYT